MFKLINYDKLSKLLDTINQTHTSFFSQFGEEITWKINPSNAVTKEAQLRFLFFTVMLDYSTLSEQLYYRMKELYERNPHLFDPKFILSGNITEQQLSENFLREKIRPRYPRKAVERWFKLSYYVYVMYRGLFTNILEGVESYDLVRQRIDNLPGYGPKLTSLIIKFLIKRGFLPRSMEFELDIPVDVHVKRILYYTGVTDREEVSESEINAIQEAFKAKCKEMHLSPIIVDDYLWVLGSRLCCCKKPGKPCHCEKCSICPLRPLCKKASEVMIR